MQPQITITISPEGEIIRDKTTVDQERFTIDQVDNGIATAKSNIDAITTDFNSALDYANETLAGWQALKDKHDASIQHG